MSILHSSGDARPRYTAASPALPVPPQARRVIEVLEAAGFEAWCVGGFVRDSLLGRPVSDIDIACSALWPQTEETCLAAGNRSPSCATMRLSR